MAELRSGKSAFVSYVVAVSLLGAALLTNLVIWWLGDWERYDWGLHLTVRIVWGCAGVGALAALLTRVTIFGWYFRRYFRWGEEGPAPAKGEGDEGPRLIRAPWPKSGKASFSSTVVLVSLLGAAAVASAVLWILRDTIGEWWWIIVQIIWAGWWLGCIATVLTRVAIFGVQRSRSIHQSSPPAEGPESEKDPEEGTGGMQRS